jgi:hypothetical protein
MAFCQFTAAASCQGENFFRRAMISPTCAARFFQIAERSGALFRGLLFSSATFALRASAVNMNDDRFSLSHGYTLSREHAARARRAVADLGAFDD